MWGFCSTLQYFVSLWLLGTVIDSRVFSLQAVHLQIHLTLAVVSGDGEPPLDILGVVYATTARGDVCQPFQPFPRSLSDPSCVWISKARVCAGQFMRVSRPQHRRLRFCVSLTQGTCKKKKIQKKILILVNKYNHQKKQC